MLYVALALQVLMMIVVVVILIKLEESKKKTLTIVYDTVRILSLYALLLITIAPLPLSQIFLESVICQEGDALRMGEECYTGVHMANMIAGVAGMTITLFLSFIAQILYIDFNPSSTLPFANSQSRVGIIKLIFKICLPVYVILDYEVK